MADRLRRAVWVVAPLLLAGCGSAAQQGSPSSSSSASSPAVAVATTATATEAATTSAAAPTSFTSTTYGYSVTLPADWTSAAATLPWDGQSASVHDDPAADQWIGPGSASAWALAAPTHRDLSAFVRERIAANFATHGSRCPEKPAAQEPVTIGGAPGVLAAWNCGILINLGFAVHNGVGYLFGFRDPAVHAATDAADRATFVALLESLKLPA